MIGLREIPDWWRRCAIPVRDFPIALLLAAASFVPSLQGYGTQVGGLPSRPFDALVVVVIALQALPIVIRRTSPAVCLAVVSLGFAADQLLGYHTVAGTALPIALLSAGAHLDHHRRLTMGLITAAYIPFGFALIHLGGTEPPDELVTFYLAVAASWAVGAWLRSTRIAEAERRRHVAATTRAAERTRIARELHDVVTHHVTAMVVQAEAARYLTAAPERLDEALAAVSDTGRRAIGDLRHLLDLLNPEHSAEPVTRAVGEIRTLVEQTRRAGQPVEFTEDGDPRSAPGGAEATAYRVVQEALTNALKYAHGERTAVHIRHGVEEIRVEVTTGDPRTPTASPGGSGRGLPGLRERVGLLGGEFDAGRAPGGGFVVRARIPVEATA